MAGSTLIVDFSKVPSKFAIAEMMCFVTNNLQLKKDHMKRVHYRPSSRTVCIDVKDQRRAFHVLAGNDGIKHTVTFCGKKYNIPIAMDDGSIVVQLHDVPSSVTNEQVYEALGQYGTVITMGEGRWADKTAFASLLNGYRFVQIIVTTPIPQYVEIAGQRTLASYRGQAVGRAGRNLAEHNEHQVPDAQELVFYRTSGNRTANAANRVNVSSASTDGSVHSSSTPRIGPSASTDRGSQPSSTPRIGPSASTDRGSQPSSTPTVSGLSPGNAFTGGRNTITPRPQIVKRQPTTDSEQPIPTGSKLPKQRRSQN
ncbi:uncharacterized protein LOC125770392 [Anopheles funestus]|uniref:uncharacterized protein LOC125770392 n=1 Tax=Anopheles funestus TaxID=62324 RepID=UPI0020C6F45B|nr:uncharacterized protein LOC125770392 [Anopheles funestus]